MERLLMLAPVAALAGLLSGQALANDRDLLATPVPASSCTPFFAENAGVSTGGSEPWYNGFYGLEGRAGQAHRLLYLHCPLSVNHIELSNPRSNDNDISSFRILYRDADGFGSEILVEVFLYQTILLASGEIQNRLLCHWNSNTSRTSGTGGTGFTRTNVPCVHDVTPGSFYTLEARLITRFVGGPSPNAAFAGITFP